MNTIKYDYLYILIERNCIDNRLGIFKVGKTRRKPFDRLSEYERNSVFLAYSVVDNCDKRERELHQLLKTKFKQMLEYGNEYYKADPIEIYNEFINFTKRCFNKEAIQNLYSPIYSNNTMSNNINKYFETNSDLRRNQKLPTNFQTYPPFDIDDSNGSELARWNVQSLLSDSS
jgi:hypothetical protein